jgi:hypothetical protein
MIPTIIYPPYFSAIMKERISTFTAIGSDGKNYIVDVATNYIDAGSLTPHAVIEGQKEYRTSNGFAVKRVGKGEYIVPLTGVTLRFTSTDAP